MKKFFTCFAVALLAAFLCFAVGCGKAEDTLSSYISAMKSGNYTKASNYVVGQPELENPRKTYLGDITSYIYEKTAGDFSYTVESETVSEDGEVCTIEISYSCYSSSKVFAQYLLNMGSSSAKSVVDSCLSNMEKTEGTLTVTLVNEGASDWLLTVESAEELTDVIY